MKVEVDKEYMGSCQGILRVAAIGIGGAIFGTMADNRSVFLLGADNNAASAHFLMWVAVFAWAITTIIFISGLFSNPLFVGSSEYRINIFFAVLYLIGTVVYGRFSVEYEPFRDPKILILVFSCVNWLVYVILFTLQLLECHKNKSSNKKSKPAKKADDKVELKEETDAEAGVGAVVIENGKDEEARAEQKEQVEA